MCDTVPVASVVGIRSPSRVAPVGTTDAPGIALHDEVGAVALGEKDRVGRLPRPSLQPVADAARALAQGFARAQHDAAVGAVLGHGLGRCKQGCSVAACGGCHVFPPSPYQGSAAASFRAALAIMLGRAIVVVNNNLSLGRSGR